MELSPQKPEYKMVFLVERFEEKNAVLSNEALGSIHWPIRLMPEHIKIGDTVTLELLTEKSGEDEEYKLMRRLLEELIN